MSFSRHIDRPARPDAVVIPFGKYRGKTLGEIAFRQLGEAYRSAVVVADRFVASGHVTTGFLEPAKHFRVVCSDCGRWPCSCYHFPGEGAI